MNTQSINGDSGLVRRFFLTELFANIVGAPLAVAYGGFMIDFTRVDLSAFLVNILIIMAVNQLVLALPLNLAIGRKMRNALFSWRSGSMDEDARVALFSWITTLPLLQAGLVFARMLLSTAAALALVSRGFDSFFHISATFVFALYSSFITGFLIYQYLRSASYKTTEEIAGPAIAEACAGITMGKVRLRTLVTYLPLTVPTMITSLGIFFLVMTIRDGTRFSYFFSERIIAALVLNFLTVIPILVLGQHFHQRRLSAIQSALSEMTERGDTSRRISTDFSDDYAITAHKINLAFDLFRLILTQMESASNRLSETVLSFSSQIKETVAATTQQASAVKEVVSTMDGSNTINHHIRDQAETLSGNAQESLAFADNGFGKVQDTMLKMGEIRESNVQTLNEIGELTEEISSIGEIIEIINNIANQTRIIAFNAELEASSAGAAGTSFRIVAEEIRRLANSTVDALIGIKGRITQIQQGSDRLLATSEEGTTKIEEGMHLSADLNRIFMKLRESAESTSASACGIREIQTEQNSAFDQIFTTLKQISDGAEQVLTSAKISGTDVGKLKDLLDEIKVVLGRFVHKPPAYGIVMPAEGEIR